MRRKLATLFIVAAVGALLPASAALAQTTNQVSVLHGIPGLTVDVYVNGDLTLEDFTFETLAGPLELPDGDYEIEIFAADADPAVDTPALATGSPGIAVAGGINATIVAHLDADAAPTLSVFVNDISTIAAGEARVTVNHTAAAPAVDVLANDAVLLANIANGAGAGADAPAATYNVKVVPTGTTDPVVFETDLPLAEGANTIVFAIGDLAGDSFTVAVQSITGLAAAPSGVPTGDAGLATDALPAWMVAALGLAFLGTTAGIAIRNR